MFCVCVNLINFLFYFLSLCVCSFIFLWPLLQNCTIHYFLSAWENLCAQQWIRHSAKTNSAAHVSPSAREAGEHTAILRTACAGVGARVSALISACAVWELPLLSQREPGTYHNWKNETRGHKTCSQQQRSYTLRFSDLVYPTLPYHN